MLFVFFGIFVLGALEPSEEEIESPEGEIETGAEEAGSGEDIGHMENWSA